MDSLVLDPLAPIRAINTEKIPPNPLRTKEAFGRIGYTLSEALADLIDNSIDAKARQILIRFVYDREEVRSVYIVDDGHGMNERRLTQAMQFGTDSQHSDGDLGRYGIGLKSASYSQCNTFSVISRGHGEISGRRWTDKEIAKDWRCEQLDTDDCKRIVDSDWSPLELSKSGTVVIWNQLTGLHSAQTDPTETINREISEISTQLGMTFHRFIASGKLAIYVSSLAIGSRQPAIVQGVSPLDPFRYPASGDEDYPKTITVTSDDGTAINLNCHIWPPKSRLPEYRLGGGKVSSRQGFYFYRNDRLVQAGGWNGLRDDDSEPHLSLARVAVDLPKKIEVSVQKSQVIDLPKGLIKSAREATQKYIKAADLVYRKSKPKDDLPIVPRKGIASDLQQLAQSRLANNRARVHHIDFKWANLKPSLFFELDIDSRTIHLNETYRKAILGGSRKSINDAQALKICLFFLFADFTNKERLSKADKGRIDTINDILLRSLNA